MKNQNETTQCVICNKSLRGKSDNVYCTECKKLKPVVQFDLSNKRKQESDDDFLARKEVYTSIRDLHNLFKNKNIPKNYEIISEFLKLKNYLIHNSEYKTILEKIEAQDSTTQKPKSAYYCLNCGCHLPDNSNSVCESCDILINLGNSFT